MSYPAHSASRSSRPAALVLAAVVGCAGVVGAGVERSDTETFVLLGFDEGVVAGDRYYYAGPRVGAFRLRMRFFGDDGWPDGVTIGFIADSEVIEELAGPGAVPEHRTEGESFWSPWFRHDAVRIRLDSAGRVVPLGSLGTYLAITAIEVDSEGGGYRKSADPLQLEPAVPVDGWISQPRTRHLFRVDTGPGRRYQLYVRPFRHSTRHRIWPLVEVVGDESAGEAPTLSRLSPVGTDTGLYWEFGSPAGGPVSFGLSARASGNYLLAVREIEQAPEVSCVLPDGFESEETLAIDPGRYDESLAESDGAEPWSRFSNPAGFNHAEYVGATASAARRLAQVLSIATGELLAASRGRVRVGRVAVRVGGVNGVVACDGQGMAPLELASDDLADPVEGGRRLAVAWRTGLGAPAALPPPAPTGSYQDVLEAIERSILGSAP